MDLDKRVEELDEEIARLFRNDSACQRIGEIEGVGPLIATAMVSAIGDGRSFKNGRELSAWLGLVPRQESSGGKTRLLGISKRRRNGRSSRRPCCATATSPSGSC